MRSGKTQEQVNNVAHQRYVFWAVGDAATTEFPIGKNITRVQDLIVSVDGLIRRPSETGTAYDYSIRGITAGYTGDANTVKFAAAPGGGVNICFIVNAT